MSLVRAVGVLFSCCLLASATEPDWPHVEQHAIELLQQYVRIPSTNPPADTRATARLLADELAKAGLKAETFESGPDGKTNLIARLPGRDRSKRPLILLNHMDVVPVDAARWKLPPFGAAIQGGEMWGRGTLDMKSTGVMQLTSLMLLKQLGIVPARDIVFLSDCDEETGGKYGARWMIDQHWNELNPQYVLDEGGVGSRDVYTSGKLVFGISVADKQVLWLRIRAVGTSGHGSQPIPDNANDLLIRAIEKAKELPEGNTENAMVQRMRASVGVFASNKFINAIQRNTISITSLRSGVGDPPKANVIPSVAEATLDCRLLPGENAQAFLSAMKTRINDPHITVEAISTIPKDPPASPTDTALYKSIQNAIRTAHPDATVIPIVVPFGTDGEKFRERGAAAYGVIPMVMDAATLATMHSDSEHIPLAQFRQGLHIYFDILRADW